MSEGEQADDAQKTEDPTPKKIEESRKKGQVALSREINNWVMLFAGTILIAALASSVLGDLSKVMRTFIESSHVLPSDIGGLGGVLKVTFMEVLKILALPLIILLLAAFLAPFVQVGPLFAQMEHFVGLPMTLVMKELQSLLIWLMIGVLIVVLVIAVIDLVYQRYDNNKKMRMTKQEVKDEYKQTEGDPHVKARLRQLRMEKGRQRMMQAVPDADVVITNPTHYSIALKYDSETMEAPVCVAKGTDELALRIRETATEHGVELFENKPLARSLYDVVEVDETIPLEFYQAVAEVISFVFKRKGKLH